MYLVETRIKCAQFSKSQDAKELMKILVEIKEFGLAINLAHEHKLGIAYPMAYLIKTLYEEDDEFVFQERTWHTHPSELTVRVIPKENPELEALFEVTIDPLYKFRIKIQELISLAEALVSADVTLPVSLEEAIVQQGHIRELLVFYQSRVFVNTPKEPIMFKEAVALLKRYLPDAVENLIQSDISLLLQMLNDMQ